MDVPGPVVYVRPMNIQPIKSDDIDAIMDMSSAGIHELWAMNPEKTRLVLEGMRLQYEEYARPGSSEVCLVARDGDAVVGVIHGTMDQSVNWFDIGGFKPTDDNPEVRRALLNALVEIVLAQKGERIQFSCQEENVVKLEALGFERSEVVMSYYLEDGANVDIDTGYVPGPEGVH